MRFFKSLLVFLMVLSMLLVAVVVLAVTGGYIYLHLQKPQYAGEVSVKGMHPPCRSPYQILLTMAVDDIKTPPFN